MALVRVTALKDFTATALSTTDVSTGQLLGGVAVGQSAYAAMHLTAVSTGRTLVGIIQSATASGFGSPTTRFTFGLTSEKGSTWGAPVANISTEHKWWRFNWTLSTAVSTAGSWNGLAYMGIK